MDVNLVDPECFPFSRVGSLDANYGTNWLIESLWLENAAGIIGGQPKCCKSWLGLDMAVSVASGTPCLGRFAVSTSGPTLVYLAEDSIEEVKKRVHCICNSRKLYIHSLDLVVITAPTLRLDSEWDQKKLLATVERISPKLLLLDPLVRLHRLDENNARDIAGLLGFLREIQRKAKCAVVLTHHASKRTCVRPGQGLRGTSDLHAFGDSNLYLSRDTEDALELISEHRSAKAPPSLRLKLVDIENATHLTVIENATPVAAPALDQRILDHLSDSNGPVQRNLLRSVLRANNQRFGQSLTALLASGKIITTPDGIALP